MGLMEELTQILMKSLEWAGLAEAEADADADTDADQIAGFRA